jgi:hypothetical protein
MSDYVTGFRTDNGIAKYDYNSLANKPVRRIAEITLKASAWEGSASPYSQVVDIIGITANVQVDLTPSVEQLVIFHQKDLALVAENDDGVVTVYAIGDKPQNDYTMQVTLTEVTI